MFNNQKDTTVTNKANEKTILKQQIGERICTARKNKNWTQEQLAEKLGLGLNGQKTITKWEHGETLPKTENISALVKTLGVTFSWFFTGSGVMEQDVTLRDVAKLLFHVIPANFNCSFSLSQNIYGGRNPECKFDIDNPPKINYEIEVPYIPEYGEDYPTGFVYTSPLFRDFVQVIDPVNRLKEIRPDFIAPDAYDKLFASIPDTTLSQPLNKADSLLFK